MSNITITENTNPKIAELYQQLQDVQNKVSQIQSERMDKLSENYQAVKENEQSLENRTLTATTTAATGIGGMELTQGLAEQKADKAAEQDMTAYIENFRCEYGDGKSVKAGPDEIELPGGNDSKIMELRAEYKTLAASLKERKTALAMKPGIEAEEILDKSQSGLYDDESVGITGGTYASLYRAQMLGSEKDQEKIDSDKKTSSNRVQGGAIAAGAGVVGGIVGNATINKDAPKERSKEINQEYDKKVAEATKEQKEISQQLEKAITENKESVKKFNDQIQQHKNQIAAIKKSPGNCQELFEDYISTVSEISPIENETDSVPETDLPDISEQKLLLEQCIKCADKGGEFNSDTKACPCPSTKPIERNGKCVEKIVEQTPAPTAAPAISNNCTGQEITALGENVKETQKVDGRCEVVACDDGFTPSADKTKCESNVAVDVVEETPDTFEIDDSNIDLENDIEEEYEDDFDLTALKGERCPATGNGLKSINDKTKIGDECSSSIILVGEVVKRKQSNTCTCLAKVCKDKYDVVGGKCQEKLDACPRSEHAVNKKYKGVEGKKFCKEFATKQKCKTNDLYILHPYGQMKIICDPTDAEIQQSRQRVEERDRKYYNCCDTNPKVPEGITCRCIKKFERAKVVPSEAKSLVDILAERQIKTTLKCKDKERIQVIKGAESIPYLQCVSGKNPKFYYEFQFLSLDSGNSGFEDAFCSIWGLKGQHYHKCKKATKQQCDEISAVVDKHLFPGGSAILTGNICNIHSGAASDSNFVAAFGEAITKEDLRTVDGIDPLHFYDKKNQVNSNSSLYKFIENYLFIERGLPLKPFRCGSTFNENVNYYDMTCGDFEETQKKIAECQRTAQTYNGGGEHGAQAMGGAMYGCNKRYPVNKKSGDLLTCEYDGKHIDFLFKKLDAQWIRKSSGGYQNMSCLAEGGTLTGKGGCAVASETVCNDMKTKYPDFANMEWDENLQVCVLKDAKFVGKVQKVAETTGMVALTLVTAAAGGPVVWAFSMVEGGAIVSEAILEDKLSDWGVKFVSDAVKCNNSSNCANTVLQKHIARIVKGSKYFNEAQHKSIDDQEERLVAMLDGSILDAIVEKGEAAGYLGEDREPDLENALLSYYGTKLTKEEQRLLTGKKVATALTFASLGAGVAMAGMRQAFKRGLITLSPAKQIKWVDLKILRKTDVAEDIYMRTKTAAKEAQKAAKEAAKAEKAAGEIDDIASGTGKSWEEELAEIGVKEEKTASGASRYRDINTGKYISQEEVLKRIDNMPGKIDDITSGASKSLEEELAEIGVKEEKTASGASRYRDIETGKYISQEEVLKRIDDMPGKATTPKPVSPKPNDVKPKDTKPATPTPAESSTKSKEISGEPKTAESETPKGTAEPTPKKSAEETPKTDPKQSSKSADKAVDVEKASATGAKRTANKLDNVVDAGRTEFGKFKINKIDTVKEGMEVSVFKFTDAASGKVYYLKHTDDIDEITRTKRAYEILKGKSDIVHTVRVVEDDQEVLTKLAKAHNIDQSTGKYWFVMDEMPGSVTFFNVTDMENVEQSVLKLRNALKNKPVTVAEQDEILNAVKELNNNGIVHGDLMSNMFVTREANGKLRIDIIDYEPWSAAKAAKNVDEVDVQYAFTMLQDAGLAEKPGSKMKRFINSVKEKISNSENTKGVSKTKNAASSLKQKASDAFDNINSKFTSKGVNKVDDVAASVSKAKTPTTTGGIDDFLSRSSTLQDLNANGRLTLQTSSSLNGKQYMRISMGKAPNMQETQTLVQKLQKEGFFVSSGTAENGERFIAVSRENIFAPWSKEPGHWLAYGTDALGNSLKKKVSNNFDDIVSNLKSGKNQGYQFSKGILSDSDWKLLNENLSKDGLEVFDAGQGNVLIRKIGGEANVDSVAGAVGAAAKSENTKGVSKIKNAASSLKQKASDAFDNIKSKFTSKGVNKVDDGAEIIAEVVPDVFDARKMRVSDGSGKLYVRNSASEMLGYPVNGDDAVNEVEQLYGTIRRGIEYPVKDTKVSRAINAMEKPNNNAILYRAPTDNYNWHVHSYNGPRGSSAEVQYHVSLNVEVDDALIKKLDDIMAKDQGRHIVDFKIPPVGSRWKIMADPISIYMRGTNPEIERAIAAAAKPYVRTSSEIGLLGRKIDDGVAIAYETSAARMDIVEDIINQVARKDAGVAAKLRAKGRYSVGNTEALRLWASDFLGYTIAPVIP